jgi:hypothetical protein
VTGLGGAASAGPLPAISAPLTAITRPSEYSVLAFLIVGIPTRTCGYRRIRDTLSSANAPNAIVETAQHGNPLSRTNALRDWRDKPLRSHYAIPHTFLLAANASHEERIMRRSIPQASTAILTVLALAGCSALSPGGPGSVAWGTPSGTPRFGQPPTSAVDVCALLPVSTLAALSGKPFTASKNFDNSWFGCVYEVIGTKT